MRSPGASVTLLATMALLLAAGAATGGSSDLAPSGNTVEARGLPDVVDPGEDEASTSTAQTPTQPGWLGFLVAAPLVGGLAVAAWKLGPSRDDEGSPDGPSAGPGAEPTGGRPADGPQEARDPEPSHPSAGSPAEGSPEGDEDVPPPSEAPDATDLPTGSDLPGPDDVADAEPGVPRILRLGKEAVDQGDLEDAVEWFETALAAEPDLAVAHVCRGLSLEEMGENEEAAEAFRAATEADPGDAAARYLLARNLAQAGEPRRALVHLRQVLTLVPELADVARDDDFGPLRDDPRFLAVLGDL